MTANTDDKPQHLSGILLPLEIQMYFHCGKCLNELPGDQSPQDYSDLSVGWTADGLQVWCNRHQVNVTHLDFMGQKVRSKVIDVKDR